MRNCGYKMCPLPVFGTDKKTRIGYCKNHQFARTDRDTRTALQKHLAKQKKEPTISPFKQSIIDRRDEDELNKFFDMVAEEIAKHPYCMECGVFIPENYYRAASAHILKKSIFKSVAANPNNFLILGASCGCHHAFDNGFMTEMKVFDEAIRRYNIFKNEVTEKHKILELFNTVNTL